MVCVMVKRSAGWGTGACQIGQSCLGMIRRSGKSGAKFGESDPVLSGKKSFCRIDWGTMQDRNPVWALVNDSFGLDRGVEG